MPAEPPTHEELQEALHRDYVACFTSEAGTRILNELARRYHLGSCSLGSHGEMAFREGQRSVVIDIIAMMRRSIPAQRFVVIGDRFEPF